MHPDGIQNSPDVVSQENFPMDAASVQSKTTHPRVSARGVGRGRGRGRDSQAAAGAIRELSKSSYVLRKGNAEISYIAQQLRRLQNDLPEQKRTTDLHKLF